MLFNGASRRITGIIFLVKLDWGWVAVKLRDVIKGRMRSRLFREPVAYCCRDGKRDRMNIKMPNGKIISTPVSERA